MNSLQTISKGTKIDSIFWSFLGPTSGPTWFIFGGVRVRARVGFVRVAHFESETALCLHKIRGILGVFQGYFKGIFGLAVLTGTPVCTDL